MKQYQAPLSIASPIQKYQIANFAAAFAKQEWDRQFAPSRKRRLERLREFWRTYTPVIALPQSDQLWDFLLAMVERELFSASARVAELEEILRECIDDGDIPAQIRSRADSTLEGKP